MAKTESAHVEWKCPQCGIGIDGCHNEAHAVQEQCKADLGDCGFFCECRDYASGSPCMQDNHGESYANPCPSAVCEHCGWKGTFPEVDTTMTEIQKKLGGTFRARTRKVVEKCSVCGCDGNVTRQIQPMLMTPDDMIEMYGPSWNNRPLEHVKGAPKNALICSTRGTADVTIQGTCAEAVAYASRLNRPIAFNFNDIPFIARKGDDPVELWHAWWKRAYEKPSEVSCKER